MSRERQPRLPDREIETDHATEIPLQAKTSSHLPKIQRATTPSVSGRQWYREPHQLDFHGFRFATIVRVPESSGDSGFHRESQEDVKVKKRTQGGSAYECWIGGGTTQYRKIHRSAEHEADLDQDPSLEEKPRIPLKAATTATADLDENLDPYTTDKDTTKSKSNPSTMSSKKKKIKAARTKLKAPDSKSEDVNKPKSTIAKDMIE
ncbi:hypothetical protein PHMEG_00011257 [Phytophthora megakarya]|uniref:Uncharacterized protein n=1 Tax=Phytophthora megakarya TaxID=4795 RepID=A0A225WDD8_9STRA|nr:hypothetical protein PHMEG_00011257 [Phytophthora megakarya]